MQSLDRKKHLVLGGVLTMLLAAGASIAPALAGEWIESFKGKPTDYLIQRGNEKLRPQPLMKLKAGDKIFVIAPAGEIGILKANKRILKVTRNNAPYTVPQSPEAATVWSDLLNIASNWIAASRGNSSFTEAITHDRIPPVQVPTAPAEQNLLISGEPALAVVWRGGAAPFHVTLIDKRTKAEIITQTNIERRGTLLDLPPLKPGLYRLQITSLGSPRKLFVNIELRVVDKSQLPQQAQKLLQANLPTSIKNRLLVTILAQFVPWRFQAYDLAERHQFHAAQLALENGQYPKRR